MNSGEIRALTSDMLSRFCRVKAPFWKPSPFTQSTRKHKLEVCGGFSQGTSLIF